MVSEQEKTVAELIADMEEVQGKLHEACSESLISEMELQAGKMCGLCSLARSKLRYLENKRIVQDQRYQGMTSEFDRLREVNKRGRAIEMMFNNLVGAINEECAENNAHLVAGSTEQELVKIVKKHWDAKQNYGKEQQDADDTKGSHK